MYKLTIVDGPNVGTSYVLKNGETSLGRGSTNIVHLSSSKISKNHCVILLSNGQLQLKDLGSSNGTFVNGIMAKSREVKLGDRISIGPFIFEISETQAHSAQAMPVMVDLNASRIPNALSVTGEGNSLGSNASGSVYLGDPLSSTGPGDWQDKVMHYFEKYIMPFFYSLNLKYEWKWIATWIFASFILVTLLVSISPLLEANRQTILIESGRRAQFMAQQISEINTPRLASNSTAKTTVGQTGDEFGVQVAVIIDLQNRILAPPEKANQYLKNGDAARLALKAAKSFRKGRERGIVHTARNEIVVAIEPIKILDRNQGKNRIVAMAVVAIDATLSTPQMGMISLIYSKTLIIMLLIGAFILFLFYRLTLKPLELLNEDVDKVLQGEINQVNHDFKNEELNPLYAIINAALQRVPKTGSAGAGGSDGPDESEIDQIVFDEVSSLIRIMGGTAKAGIVVCNQERNIAYMNSIFEEVSGINLTEALGQDLSAMARDQAFGELVVTLFDAAQVSIGSEVVEDFDFSGINYEMKVIAFGRNNPVGFLLSAMKKDESDY